MTTPREDAIVALREAARAVVDAQPMDWSVPSLHPDHIEVHENAFDALMDSIDALDRALAAETDRGTPPVRYAPNILDLDSPEAAERLAGAWGEVMDGRRIGSGLNAARIDADTTTGDDWAAILAAMRETGR